MENLSIRKGVVTVFRKILRQRQVGFHQFRSAHVVAVAVNSAPVRHEAREQRRARWTADRPGAIGLLEHDGTIFGEAIEVGRGRFFLRSTAKGTDPVVEVVDGDEQHVVGRARFFSGVKWERGEANDGERGREESGKVSG